MATTQEAEGQKSTHRRSFKHLPSWQTQGQFLYVAETNHTTFIFRHSLHTERARVKFRKKGIKRNRAGFPGGAVAENLPANAGDTGSSPGLGRSHMPRSD